MNLINDINKKLLWNVILKKKIEISYDFFIEQLNSFYNSSSIDKLKYASKEVLMDFNKKCLVHIVNAVKKKSNEEKENPYKSPEEEYPYKFEDLQNIKREKFNNELTKKQYEFSLYNQKPIPLPFSFNEESDKPIEKIEDLISQTISKRELELQQFQKYYPPPPIMANQQSAPKLLTIMDNLEEEKEYENEIIDIIEPIELDLDQPPLETQDRISVLEKKIDLILYLLQTK